MDKAIDVHDHVVRTQLGRFNGYEVTTEGDAFLMAFHDASDAIAWTLATQQVSAPFCAVGGSQTLAYHCCDCNCYHHATCYISCGWRHEHGMEKHREPSTIASAPLMTACLRPLMQRPKSRIIRLLMRKAETYSIAAALVSAAR